MTIIQCEQCKNNYDVDFSNRKHGKKQIKCINCGYSWIFDWQEDTQNNLANHDQNSTKNIQEHNNEPKLLTNLQNSNQDVITQKIRKSIIQAQQQKINVAAHAGFMLICTITLALFTTIFFFDDLPQNTQQKLNQTLHKFQLKTFDIADLQFETIDYFYDNIGKLHIQGAINNKSENEKELPFLHLTVDSQNKLHKKKTLLIKNHNEKIPANSKINFIYEIEAQDADSFILEMGNKLDLLLQK